jgi:hypothetical protein
MALCHSDLDLETRAEILPEAAVMARHHCLESESSSSSAFVRVFATIIRPSLGP